MAALPFFYIDSSPVYAEFIQLDEANSKHIVTVLRMKQDEQIHLTDGRGNLLLASILETGKRKCVVKVLDKQYHPAGPAAVSIAISPVKNVSRMEWFLEKATETGVSEIIPLICQRTEKLHFRFERMQQILISAMLQSQQVWLPRLQEPMTFDAVVRLSRFSAKWIAHCLPGNRLSLREQGPATTAQLLLIGPEGDFSPAEIELALQEGCKAVALGSTRLRTETAGIAGATLLCID